MKIDAGAVKEQMRRLINSPQFEPYASGLLGIQRPHNGVRIVIGSVAIVSIVAIPFGLAMFFGAWLRSRLYRGRLQELQDRLGESELITVWIQMANGALYREPGAMGPALGIGTFQDDDDSPDGYMALLMDQLMFTDVDDPVDESERTIQKMLQDESYHPMRRRRVPDAITAGLTVHLFDLGLSGSFFRSGKLDDARVVCLATQGDEGIILPVPYWILDAATQAEPVESPPPSPAAESVADLHTPGR